MLSARSMARVHGGRDNGSLPGPSARRLSTPRRLAVSGVSAGSTAPESGRVGQIGEWRGGGRLHHCSPICLPRRGSRLGADSDRIGPPFGAVLDVAYRPAEKWAQRVGWFPHVQARLGVPGGQGLLPSAVTARDRRQPPPRKCPRPQARAAVSLSAPDVAPTARGTNSFSVTATAAVARRTR